MLYKIEVQIKNVYGNETIYPLCDQAKRFALLLGQKTLTHRDIGIIKNMGFKVEVISQGGVL